MKTLKASKPSKKAIKRRDQSKSKTINDSVNLPSEKDIREKANDIYLQRLERGEQGTSIDDWLEAEAYLKDYDY